MTDILLLCIKSNKSFQIKGTTTWSGLTYDGTTDLFYMPGGLVFSAQLVDEVVVSRTRCVIKLVG